MLGKIDFNPDFVNAMVECKSIVDYKPESHSVTELKNVFSKFLK